VADAESGISDGLFDVVSEEFDVLFPHPHVVELLAVSGSLRGLVFLVVELTLLIVIAIDAVTVFAIYLRANFPQLIAKNIGHGIHDFASMCFYPGVVCFV